jgi:glucokinase
MTTPSAKLVGVDLGGTKVRAGRVEQGLRAHASFALQDKGDADGVLKDVCATIDQVMTPDVQGIGIGVPSVVDPIKGIVYSVANIPSWQEVHLKDILEARYQIPVQVNNDANCFALGEYHYGLGQQSNHMVGLVLGTGLGAGLVVRGRLFNGANCGAGEIGYLAHGQQNLEYLVSGPRFDRRYGVDGGTLLVRAQTGDSSARQAFADFGTDLGLVIKTVLYAYDPDTIILGGSVSQAFPFFQTSMLESLKDFAFPHVLDHLRILQSQDPHIPILGAAALCLDAAS